MTQPIKKAGFAQGIYEQSSTAKETLGTLRWTKDGRAFRYARAGEGLSPFKMGLCASIITADHIGQAITAAVSVGAYTLDLTVATGTAIAEDQLRGGYFQIPTGTAPQNYMIAGNTSIGSSDTSIQVALDDPLRVALTSSSEFSLVQSPWWAVYVSDTAEQMCAGVPQITISSGYYYWAQTHGICPVYQEATDLMGCNMCVSTNTAGAVLSIATTVILANLPIVGIQYGTQGEANEYTPVFLTID